MQTLLVVAFLVAHALIHASFVRPRPPATASGPQWPFDLAHSWLLSPAGVGERVLRIAGMALVGLVLLGYAGAALATAGIAPAAAFVPGVALGSIASVALLALFFHPWLVLGFVIDAVLLWATFAAGWRPGALELT